MSMAEYFDPNYFRWTDSINDFYTNCYCYYCSYTRDFLCYFDKMCLVCLRYYLHTIHVDDGDRHGVGTSIIRVLVVLRNDKMELDGLHVNKNRHEMRGDKLDGGDVHKVLHT